MEFAWKDANVVLFMSTVDSSKFATQKWGSASSDVIYRQVELRFNELDNALLPLHLAPAKREKSLVTKL
jgi:hypothetical protein